MDTDDVLPSKITVSSLRRERDTLSSLADSQLIVVNAKPYKKKLKSARSKATRTSQARESNPRAFEQAEKVLSELEAPLRDLAETRRKLDNANEAWTCASAERNRNIAARNAERNRNIAARNAERNSKSAIILRMPEEVLVQIFIEAGCMSRDSGSKCGICGGRGQDRRRPLEIRLLVVCKPLHEIVLKTPHLWNTILPFASKSLSGLQVYLSRSKVLPLKVVIEVNSDSLEDMASEGLDYDPRLAELMPHVPRLQSLCLWSTSHSGLNIATRPFHRLEATSLTSLHVEMCLEFEEYDAELIFEKDNLPLSRNREDDDEATMLDIIPPLSDEEFEEADGGLKIFSAAPKLSFVHMHSGYLYQFDDDWSGDTSACTYPPSSIDVESFVVTYDLHYPPDLYPANCQFIGGTDIRTSLKCLWIARDVFAYENYFEDDNCVSHLRSVVQLPQLQTLLTLPPVRSTTMSQVGFGDEGRLNTLYGLRAPNTRTLGFHYDTVKTSVDELFAWSLKQQLSIMKNHYHQVETLVLLNGDTLGGDGSDRSTSVETPDEGGFLISQDNSPFEEGLPQACPRLQNLVMVDEPNLGYLEGLIGDGNNEPPKYLDLRAITLCRSNQDASSTAFKLDVDRLHNVFVEQKAHGSRIKLLRLVGVPLSITKDEAAALREVEIKMGDIGINVEIHWARFGYESFMESLFGGGCLRYLEVINPEYYGQW